MSLTMSALWYRSRLPDSLREEAPPCRMDPTERPTEPRRHGSGLVYAEAFLAYTNAQAIR